MMDWEQDHGTITEQLDAALEDPTLVHVGASLAAYHHLVKGKGDEGPGDLSLLVLPRIPGFVFVFWYDRHDKPLRLLGMDEAGAAWAFGYSQKPNGTDLVMGWHVDL